MKNGAEAGRPRILMVGRTRYSLPLPDWLGRKFDALERQLDFRVIASVDGDNPTKDERFRLLEPSRVGLLDGVLFYLRLPFHVRRQIIDFRPDAIMAESPYSAAASLVGRAWTRGQRPQVIVEIHGDWRTATRLYGSPSRRVLSPLADAVGRIALRRGDAVRGLSTFTEGLVEEVRGIPVTASFVAYVDLSAFTAKPVAPLPEQPTALFVGMLEAYKNIDGLVAAWRLVVRELPDARLVIVGKGARRDLVDQLVADLPDNVEHVEHLPPESVAERMDASTILLLPSRSEGLPRVVIESFARGRGLVASRAGGIPDAARHEEEALLVDYDDVDGLAAALVRALSDRALAEKLARNAHERFRIWRTTPAEYAAHVRSLVDATLRDSGAVPGERPRVLIVSAAERTASPARTDPALDALREEVDYCVLAPGERGVAIRRAAVGPGSVQLVRRWPGFLDVLFFYGALPFRVRRLVRRFRPGAVIAESPYIGFFVLMAMSTRRRDRPSVVVETHGDWRTTTRHGGSRLRVLVAPLADWAARYALRHADALRAVSPFTAELAGREAGLPPVESFPAYIDLGAFTGQPPAPLPERPTLLFVGMLERSKGVTALADAWPLVAERVPDARLVLVGRGALRDVVDRLRDDYPGRVEHVEQLLPQAVAERMDAATCLVLPSRSEGLGRVILEAFARGRAVVATRVGGIPDLVEHDVNGLLVESGNVAALADALTQILTEDGLAARLGAAAYEASETFEWSPDDYAARVRSLVDRTLSEARH
ncbi:MAG TPA: glycosyltransferase family 4 protein [Gaiellaceae bacterium]|nr:glycosyltransferase family 4 protein [Gaiellaceae bacterium]